MIEKCYSCKTGHLKASGSHLFCDKCSFSAFIITQGYIDACVVVLSELVSNTSFKARSDVGHAILDHITMHLPLLDRHLSSVVNGQLELGAAIMLAVEAQAINLQIGEEVLNPDEAEKSLRCQCGFEGNFEMLMIGTILCKSCEAEYKYNEVSGIYEPVFLCTCGWAAYEEEDKHIVGCANCDKPYMRTVNGFQAIGKSQ